MKTVLGVNLNFDQLTFRSKNAVAKNLRLRTRKTYK